MNNKTSTIKPRSNTWSANDYIKRKREKEGPEAETSTDIFKKSRKTVRSPTKLEQGEPTRQQEETDMGKDTDELKDMIQNMMKIMEQGFKSNKTELEKIRTEMQEKEKTWQKEKRELEQRITSMEKKIWQQERNEKRNNIVIKGAKINETNMKEELENMINEDTGIEIKIIEAYSLGKATGRNIIVAKIEQRGQKILLMKNKNKLRGKNYFIEDDLTKEEQEVQKKIVARAREERNRGLKTKIGYKKLIIEDKKYIWNDTDKNLQPETKNAESKN